MLTVIIEPSELWDEVNERFIQFKDRITLELEHSLVSVSKWESKFRKPFLSNNEKSQEEIAGYFEAMIISGEVPENMALRWSDENIIQINEYMSSEQSATTFSETAEQRSAGRSEIVTSELIYFWMVSYQIPLECENWHLNRLFALLRICNIKNTPPKKRSASEIARERREINARRKEELGTTG